MNKNTLFEIDWLHKKNELNDSNKEFADFGEFKYNSKNIMGYKTLTVHFENKQDFELFVKITKLPISAKIKWTWFPFKKRKKNRSLI